MILEILSSIVLLIVGVKLIQRHQISYWHLVGVFFFGVFWLLPIVFGLFDNKKIN
jgi:uncharacterized protein YhhL (DUF1145 family)